MSDKWNDLIHILARMQFVGKYNCFLFLVFINFQLYSQITDYYEFKCDSSVKININGVNQCIDTSVRFFQKFDYLCTEWDDYLLYQKTQNMKLLGEKKWFQDTSIKNQIRFLFIEYDFSKNTEYNPSDTVFLFTFSDLDKDTVSMIKKQMKTYFPPSIKPDAGLLDHSVVKKQFPFWQDTVYYFNYGDSRLYTINKLVFDSIVNRWYEENYAHIDSVEYTICQYFVPQEKFLVFMNLLNKFIHLDTNDIKKKMYYPYPLVIEYNLNGSYALTMTMDKLYDEDVKNKRFIKYRNKLIKYLFDFAH
jgi:hypothetical protein